MGSTLTSISFDWIWLHPDEGFWRDFKKNLNNYFEWFYRINTILYELIHYYSTTKTSDIGWSLLGLAWWWLNLIQIPMTNLEPDISQNLDKGQMSKYISCHLYLKLIGLLEIWAIWLFESREHSQADCLVNKTKVWIIINAFCTNSNVLFSKRGRLFESQEFLIFNFYLNWFPWGGIRTCNFYELQVGDALAFSAIWPLSKTQFRSQTPG